MKGHFAPERHERLAMDLKASGEVQTDPLQGLTEGKVAELEHTLQVGA